MIDVIGAIVLTGLAVASIGALILASPLERSQALRLVVIAGAWLAAVATLAGTGVFISLGAPAIGLSIVAPLVIISIAALRTTAVRTVAFGAPLALLVAFHVGRLLGAFFLVLHGQGRLPTTFALGAGWGDIAVAVLALPVAWMVARQSTFWRPVTLLWNIVAFIDLVSAVTLGIGSTPDFPLRFIFEETIPGTMASLPWALIPGFLVPLYLLAHLAVFARVLVPERASRRVVAAHSR